RMTRALRSHKPCVNRSFESKVMAAGRWMSPPPPPLSSHISLSFFLSSSKRMEMNG
ncbi:hypothetical protein PIB30_032670, partial [Stylosanthes scabra]|nr:hypothetical protein [Stylosanthes scabra]